MSDTDGKSSSQAQSGFGQGQGIPVEELLAAPLLAANHANQSMAKEQVEFIMDYCFAKDESKKNVDGDVVYHPVTIVMSLTSFSLTPAKKLGDSPELTEVVTNFQLPLVTLVPFNSLSINEVTIDFAMEVTSSFISKETDKLHFSIAKGDDSPDETKKVESPKRVKLKGTVSYDSDETHESQYETRNSSKITVNMKASTLPLPLGLKSILELYSKNINPKQVEASSFNEEA